MNLEERIRSLAALGAWMGSREDPFFSGMTGENPWFTPREIRRAFTAWVNLLTRENLTRWMNAYPFTPNSPRDILVIPAANIPLVGFHDFLSVLITGNRYLGRLSYRDRHLLPLLSDTLISINSGFRELIRLADEPAIPDAVIATGSTNTARYFRSRYELVPSIIRQNRVSVAVLTGHETQTDYAGLAADILTYYGLGCRSVSHVFLPAGTSIESLIRAIGDYSDWDPNPMMADNVRFQKARYGMLNQPFIETAKLLLCENASLHSPIGTLHYSFYPDPRLLEQQLTSLSGELQCIVGTRHTPFGQAQKPGLLDYADQVDTIRFLITLTS